MPPAPFHRALSASALLALGLIFAPSAKAADFSRITHVHGLAVDLANPSRLLIATHNGLLSIEPSLDLTPVSADKSDFMGFVAHPGNPMIFFASGHPHNGGNMGVLKSTDGGRSFTKIADGVDGPVDFHAMTISRANSNVMYGAFRSMQRSEDGGLNWKSVGAPPKGLIALAAGARDADRLFAATEEGIVLSLDGGKSWKPAHLAKRPVTAVHVTAKGTVYAYMMGTGLVSSEESDQPSWRMVKAESDGSAILFIASAASDSQRLYVYDNKRRFLESRDGGKSWKEMGK
jgi:photosystem II stability/assembly factor-like uncharacterized protein